MKTSFCQIAAILAAAFTSASATFAHAQIVRTQTLRDYSERIYDHSIPMVGVNGGTYWVTEYIPTEQSEFGGSKWQVAVSPFWIGKYELRVGEYKEWLGELHRSPVTAEDRRAHAAFGYDSLEHGLSHGCNPREANTDDHPIVGIHQWNGKRFCHWLSMRTGRFYRLPTEAEWEFAARAGNLTGRYPWGDSPDQLAKYAVTAPERGPSLQVVGTKKPNAWGIYDMIGNAEEWVADGFEMLRFRGSRDPITWPASRNLSQPPQEIWDAFRARREHFCDNWGVAKGGSHYYRRCQKPMCFTVAARTNPSVLSNEQDPVLPQTQDTWRDLVHDFGEAVGFRIARPLRIPDRTTQLWHWGIYFDHDQWIDLTLEPTKDEEPDEE